MRTLAIIALLGLLAPASRAQAACASAGYDGIVGGCCCDSGEVEAAPAMQQIERSCCCDIDRPDPAHEVPPSAAMLAATDAAVDAPAPSAAARWLLPPTRVAVPSAPARGPPPGGRTLLSLKTSLIC